MQKFLIEKDLILFMIDQMCAFFVPSNFFLSLYYM